MRWYPSVLCNILHVFSFVVFSTTFARINGQVMQRAITLPTESQRHTLIQVQLGFFRPPGTILSWLPNDKCVYITYVFQIKTSSLQSKSIKLSRVFSWANISASRVPTFKSSSTLQTFKALPWHTSKNRHLINVTSNTFHLRIRHKIICQVSDMGFWDLWVKWPVCDMPLTPNQVGRHASDIFGPVTASWDEKSPTNRSTLDP